MKKLSNNQGVLKSSTLAGQRELIREMRNKINEIIELISEPMPDPLNLLEPKDRTPEHLNEPLPKPEQTKETIPASFARLEPKEDKCKYCSGHGNIHAGYCRELSPEPSSWEEEFDNKFILDHNAGDAWMTRGDFDVWKKGNPKEVKDFIRTNFVAKNEIIEKIDGSENITEIETLQSLLNEEKT